MLVSTTRASVSPKRFKDWQKDDNLNDKFLTILITRVNMEVIAVDPRFSLFVGWLAA